MSLLYLIGWAILGAVVATCLVAFWDEIRMWLNNTAANAVERVLGYGARERMHRATARIDRVMDKIRNRTVVYTKRSELDSFYDKTTLVSEESIYEISDDIINEINYRGVLIQEFEYRN